MQTSGICGPQRGREDCSINTVELKGSVMRIETDLGRLMGILLFVFVSMVGMGQDKSWYPAEWGPGDQRGAANRLTAQKALEASQLIKQGKIYQLGRVYEDGMPNGRFRSYQLHIPVPLGPAGKNDAIAFTEYVCGDIGQI